MTAEEPDLLGFALAHHASQIAGTKAAIKTANPWPGLTKNSVLCRQAEVAEQVQYLTTTDRISGHKGNHHLGQAANDPLKVEHVEAWQASFVEIAPIAAHALVAT